MKIAVLSNTNVNILIKNLKKSFEIYESSGYGNYIEEMIRPESCLHTFEVDILFLILDGEELIEKHQTLDIAWENLEYAVTQFKDKHPSVEIYISNLDIHDVIKTYESLVSNEKLSFRWNAFLESSFNNGVRMFDVNGLIKTIGRDEFYSESLWYLASTKYSNKGMKAMEDSLHRIIRGKLEPRKKCLVLDLDNTIWGGVLGEEGPNGIKISTDGDGRIYYDFQKEIKKIKDLGIILCIASKNNHEEVERAFAENSNLLLRLDDFSIIKANWNEKTENIKEIAKELNIGLDSMVFIDDNPLERELVKINLQEVAVPEFPTNLFGLRSFIRQIYLDYYYTISLTQEDMDKTNQYLVNEERKQSASKFENYQEYIEYLEIQIDFYQARDDDWERAAQLSQKTNQFNLTTKRFTVQELKEIQYQDDSTVFIGRVQDRFGDYGKVILVITSFIENKMVIDTFLMSCRVMGKQIESRILNEIEGLAKEMKLDKVEGHYIETKKNVPVKTFYEEHGYILREVYEDVWEYIKELS